MCTIICTYVPLLNTCTLQLVFSSCTYLRTYIYTLCQPVLPVSTSDKKYRFGVPFKVLIILTITSEYTNISTTVNYTCIRTYVCTYIRTYTCVNLAQMWLRYGICFVASVTEQRAEVGSILQCNVPIGLLNKPHRMWPVRTIAVLKYYSISISYQALIVRAIT